MTVIRIKYILLIFLINLACKRKSDRIFDESPDERMQRKIKEYGSILTASEHGWKSFYTPSDKYGTYTYLFKFLDNGKVEIVGDIEGSKTTTNYSIKSLNGPTLVFETYSSLHLLSDPGKGIPNKGYEGNFEFIISKANSDTLFCLEKVNKKEILFIKCSGEEWDNLEKNILVSEMINEATKESFFGTLDLGDSVNNYEIFLNSFFRRISILYPDDSNNKIIHTSALQYTPKGFILTKPFVVENSIVNEFIFDEISSQFNLTNSTLSGKLVFKNNSFREYNFTKKKHHKHNSRWSVYGVSKKFRDTYNKLNSIGKFNSTYLFPYYSKKILNLQVSIFYDDYSNRANINLLVEPQQRKDHLKFNHYSTTGTLAENFTNNSDCMEFFNFLTDSDGHFMVPENEYAYWMISKNEPSKFLLIIKR